jgi:hypothetical protein
MDINIAISAAMTVPMEHLREVQSVLHNKYDVPNQRIYYWDRAHEYDQSAFNRSNAVVVILNDFAYDSSKSDYFIPIGVHRELQEANKQHKKVFLAYKRKSDNVLNLYNATYILGNGDNFKGTSIKGNSGSSGPNGAFCGWLKTLEGSETKQDFFIDQKEREEELRQWEAAHRIMQNSTYGAFGELDHPSEQIKFPEVRRVYAQTVSLHQFDNGFDERLLLML